LMQESLLVRLFCWPQGCAVPHGKTGVARKAVRGGTSAR